MAFDRPDPIGPSGPPPTPPIAPGAPEGGRRRGRLAPLLLALLLLAGGGAAWLYQHLRASLPRLDGELAVAGLEAPVLIERDDLGVATIRGASRVDVARGLGFAHGQDRFFQMDLMRRRAAGELAELVGAAALPLDRRLRLHRFRHRADRVLAALTPEQRALGEAYAEGVDSGLRSLGATPFEYLVLRARPAPWTPADSILVVYSMYVELNDETGRFESARGLVDELLGPRLLDFLAPLGNEWDAPIVGEPFADPQVPGPEALDLRATPPPAPPAATGALLPGASEPLALGSNNWALAGERSAHGGALLANDMHLGLGVPNIWYRASLVFPDPRADGGGELRITGVTLPGAPFVIVGSNGRVAWGFTNTWGDWEDLVVLEPAPGEPDAYRTPAGPRPFRRLTETLRVRGGEAETLEVVETLWGPVVDRDHRGRQRALRWIAHDPEAVTFALLDLERAGDVDQALAAANRIGAPPQNIVVADSGGRIGWTVMGPMPRRFGHDGRLPSSWADGTRGWEGWLAPDEYPRVVDPPGGRIWTANSRVVDGEMMARIGLGTYRLGARARQIRDGLAALDRAAETDLLAVQLDDRALFLERWQRLLVETLTPAAIAGDRRRGELRRLAEDWGARAGVGSPGYRMVRAFRLILAEQALGAITASCKAADERFDIGLLLLAEGALWRLVEERPPHLLDPRFESWDQQLLAAVDATLEYFLADGGRLEERTWGERNRAAIRHPLSAALPPAARWLDMPADLLPGDSHMPRFQTPSEGASERLVVSPGREEQGIFHMPAGQSGHPLSPFYRAGHAAWVRGEPTPFLPGPAVHSLILRPPGS